MAGKRKDKNGRVLRTGENQRKNGTYDYRYTDSGGKVRCVYAKSLDALRRRENEIQMDIAEASTIPPVRSRFRSWSTAISLSEEI